MGLPSLSRFLRRHQKIGLDSSVFIFGVEQNAKYAELVHPIFQWLEQPGSRAVTATVTMLELLVHPYRRSDIDAVNRFYSLLSTYPGLQWAELTLAIADLAARLRAELNLKTPDAIHAATALASQATGFISNDPAFKRVENLDVLVLDDLTAGPWSVMEGDGLSHDPVKEKGGRTVTVARLSHRPFSRG